MISININIRAQEAGGKVKVAVKSQGVRSNDYATQAEREALVCASMVALNSMRGIQSKVNKHVKQNSMPGVLLFAAKGGEANG